MLVENGVEMLIRAANREQGIGIKFGWQVKKIAFHSYTDVRITNLLINLDSRKLMPWAISSKLF